MSLFLLFVIVIMAATSAAAVDAYSGTTKDSSSSPSSKASSCETTTTNESVMLSSLERARQLQAPVATSTLRGEGEDGDFWANHSTLLREAWREWESQPSQQRELPPLQEHMHDLLDEHLHAAIREAWKSQSAAHHWSLSSSSSSLLARKEEAIRHLVTKVAPDVYTFQLFSPTGVDRIRRYLDASSFESSGIPTRRPNGMNRYGMILYSSSDDNGDEQQHVDGIVSLQEFHGFVDSLLDTYIRPLGRLLFSQYVSSKHDDDSQAYAFSIRYKEGEDVALQEHFDASLYTINVNLNLPHEHYGGSSLYFVTKDNDNKHSTQDANRRQQKTHVHCQPGMAVIHLGQVKHAALPILAAEADTTNTTTPQQQDDGQETVSKNATTTTAAAAAVRTNMVVWLYGKDGQVRIAPYDDREQMTPKQRWSSPSSKNSKATSDQLDFEL